MALRAGLRSYDLIVRYGGDEFLCVLSGTAIEGARRRFDEVSRHLSETSTKAFVSLGLAALENPETLNELSALADAGLYAGRRRTREAS